jgi:hypothetical protein
MSLNSDDATRAKESEDLRELLEENVTDMGFDCEWKMVYVLHYAENYHGGGFDPDQIKYTTSKVHWLKVAAPAKPSRGTKRRANNISTAQGEDHHI